MVDLPEELFENGSPDKKREYFFINLEGKGDCVELNFGDRLSSKKCLLDGANLVIYAGDPHTVIECPACRTSFSGYDLARKYIERDFIPETKSKLNNLKKEVNYLEKMLNLAEYPNNEIKKANLENEAYNKDNLSANTGTSTGQAPIV
jgi:hypothetical protein